MRGAKLAGCVVSGSARHFLTRILEVALRQGNFAFAVPFTQFCFLLFASDRHGPLRRSGASVSVTGKLG